MRKRSWYVLLLGAALLATLSCGGAPEPPAATLRFTAIPDQNTTELMEKFQPLASYLSNQLSVTVEYVPARDYQASVEMFKNGDVLLVWYGGLTGVQARQAVPGARAIAQGDTDPTYYSCFIANKSTGLTKQDSFPMEIAKLKFTFGSESSTSGRLMPEYFIRQNSGKSPQEFFSNPVGFSGSHDKTVELVESGQYEAGVVNYLVYERRVKEGQTDPEVCRVIWQTPTFTDYNWTAHPDLETLFRAGFTDRLQQTLVNISDPSLLSALPRERLVPASNEDYEQLREVAEQLDMLR